MGNRKDCVTPSARTPGPWTARATLSGVTICNPEGVAVAKTPCCDRQALADGAVLAAAPDLLEALKTAADEMAREDFGTLTLLPTLRDAIAKAEGRPS